MSLVTSHTINQILFTPAWAVTPEQERLNEGGGGVVSWYDFNPTEYTYSLFYSLCEVLLSL